MRIRAVTAHAFGPLRDETLEFGDGMTVIVGDNESAKSSWHAAIYAGLCGRRRGRGRPREEEQRFIDLHKPWHGDDWLVSAEVVLDDGRRIEFRQDLAGKVDCHAKDLVVGTDVSAEVMNEGAPDGSRWLGLDRSSFMATACVEQAQVLRVLDGAGGLQQQLQRAADTAGADATAASALRHIDEFERERIGRDWPNSTKPLRGAIDLIRHCEQGLAAARQAHAEYLSLAAEAGKLRDDAESADAELRAGEAAAAAHEAAELAGQARRVAELRAALGDAQPAPAAAEDALAHQVTEALTRWRNRPPEPSPAAPSAAEIQQQVDALPPMPDGDLAVHRSVTQAHDELQRVEAQLQLHDMARPAAPGAMTTAAGASDQELAELALTLETPVAGVDPGLVAAEEAARRELGAAGGRQRAAGVLLAGAAVAAIAAAALLASGKTAVGVVALGIAVVLVIIGLARRRAGSVGVIRRHAELEAKLSAARQQVSAAEHKRVGAVRRCGELGLAADPQAIREVIAARIRAASYAEDLSRWQRLRAGLQEKVRSAEGDLLSALAARGHRAATPTAGGLSAAVDEYGQACVTRARQAEQAMRREDLANQLEARQQQERRADEDRLERSAAAQLVAEAGRACGLRAGPPETTVAALEKWLGQRAEQMEHADKARQQSADLEALLQGRSLDELAEQAAAGARKADGLAARADRGLLAATDQATAAGRLPSLHEQAREAGNRAASAAGELRRFAASVPSVPEAEEALEGARVELTRVRQLQETLTLTRRLLENAQDRVHRDIAPALAETLKQWLPGITVGRYTDVLVNPSSLQVEVCGPSRDWRAADRLSYGTAEQVYLLLRIALADHLTRGHDTCPLILDEVTVHADAARTSQILDLLMKIAEQRQVILFTQEEQVAAWAGENLTSPEHAVRTLPPVPAG
jgi:exonuclease SbcC